MYMDDNKMKCAESTVSICGYSKVNVAKASRTKFATVARAFEILARPQFTIYKCI